MASEVSFAPPVQDDRVAIGSWIKSTASLYQVEAFLGQGSFGKVVKCLKMGTNVTVAVKMIKNKGSYAKQAKEEVAALAKLKTLDPDKCNIVRWYQVFPNRGHICLMFEHLDQSLFDFMKERHFQPLLLKEIRPIVQQLANALEHLRTAGIIHADLKLENVMLVNHAAQPYRVKVIDFGIACELSSATVGSYIQTRPYRAPEIILGLPFTEAIDVWSLGCMVAYMYLGCLLYPAMNSFDLMRYIVETQGLPPQHLLNSGQKTSQFFQKFYSPTFSVWRLKRPELYQRETGIQPLETRRLNLRSLDDILHIRVIKHENPADRAAGRCELLMFVDMLKRMLQLDAAERITPHQVLEHQFTSMCSMIKMYPLSSHVRSSINMMTCQSKTEASDSGKAECGSRQQPPSRTAQPVQDNPPPPAAGSTVVQPRCTNPRPCTSTHTTTADRSGMKRRVDDEDGRTSHLSKKAKYELADHQYSRAAPANSSSQARTSLRSHCSQSMARSGTKRKVADGQDSERQMTTSDRYHEDRKRYRRTSPHPSTSNPNSWTQRSDHKRKRDRGRSASSSSRNRESPLRAPSSQRRRTDEYHRCSSHTSVSDGRDHPATSSSNSRTQSSERERERDRDSTRHVRHGRSRSPAEHHRRSSHTSVADGRDQGRQERTSDPRHRYDDDRSKFRQSFANPATSSRSTWTQRSERERERDRDSTCHVRHDRSRSPAEHHRDRAHSSQKREAAEEEDVRPRRRHSDHWSDKGRERSAVRSEEDRRRRADYDNDRRRERHHSRDSRGRSRERSPPRQP